MVFDLTHDVFGKLVASGRVEKALNEPDFVMKAGKLFDLREDLWDAFSETKKEITRTADDVSDEQAAVPVAVAFVTGTAAIMATAACFGAAIAGLGNALYVGSLSAIGGMVIGSVTNFFATIGTQMHGMDKVDEIEEKREKTHALIDRELGKIEKQLPSMSLEERNKYRDVFQKASLRQKKREDKILSQQKRDAAFRRSSQVAATSAVTAVGSAMVFMGGR